MLSNLLSSINSNINNILDKLVFLDTNSCSNLAQVVGVSPKDGLNLICNALIFGFLLYYATSYLLSHLTFSQVENPFQFIFKLVLCAIALNFSYSLCSGLVYLNSNISQAIREVGNYMFGYNISFEGFMEYIIPKNYFLSNSFSLFNFNRNFKTHYFIWILKPFYLLCY